MKRILTFSGLLAILTVGWMVTPAALTQTTTGIQPTSKASVFVTNQCQLQVSVSILTWFSGNTAIKTQIILPPKSIPAGSTVEFPYDGDTTPTSVQIAGAEGSSAFTLTVEANSTAKSECVSASMRTAGGQTQPPSEVPNTTEVPVPNELSGLQGLTPQQVISTLQARGFQVEVQGSEANPKVSDVDDPILLRAMASGFQAQGVFVSAPGQLRAAMTYDQPNANVVMIVIGGGFCLSLSPTFVGVGGLSVSCDRPAIMAPFTTVGGGPVPGFVFLVLTIKLGGPTLPYVLSLSV